MNKVGTVLAAVLFAAATSTAVLAQAGGGGGAGGAAGAAGGSGVGGSGAPNVNHTPCGTTASQNNGTNSGANTFPNSTAQNQQPGQKSGGAPNPRSGC
jgi:hypothetical protein